MPARPAVDVKRWRVPIALGLAVLAFGLAAIAVGQGNSWDLRNYHLYDGWAFWTGRPQDLAAAQLQTWFNPLLATATWLLFVHTPPWLSSLVLSCLQGANLLPLYVLARQHLPASLQRAGRGWALAVAAAGATTATQWGELGASFGDTLLSLPLLGAYALAFAPQGTSSRRLLGAALAGATCGLKLTTAPFALGLVLALPLTTAGGAARLRLLVLGIGAAALGFLLTDGFWLWQLWREFGDPLFPLGGRLFGGELAAPVPLRDTRWLPRTAGEWLAYPLVWATSPRRVSEQWFLDLRLGLLWLALPLLLARLRGRATQDATGSANASDAGRSTDAASATTRALGLAAAVSYLAWLAVFGYHRYLAPLEMLAPLLLARVILGRGAGRTSRLLLGAALALLVLTTRPAQWGHLAERQASFLRIDLPPLPGLERATVVLAENEPLSFLALGFPPGARFVRIGGNLMGPPIPAYGLDRAAAARIAAADGPLYALLADPASPAAAAALARQALHRSGDCAALRANLLSPPHGAWLCPLRRAGGD